MEDEKHQRLDQSERRHFETFDALRFFAFIKVFLFHLPLTSSTAFVFLKNGGGIGVFFFFVLSGFLITYILLEEKDRTGRIQLPQFFMRRVVRIWPLYYLMIAFAFSVPFVLNALDVTYSNTGYQPDWTMSLLFLENYKIMMEQMYPNVSPLGLMWSLCVEEHFYIIWGIILYVVPVKKVPLVIACSILLSILFQVVYITYDIWPLDICTNLVYFAFGAIPAYVLVVHKKDMERLMNEIPFVYKAIWIMCTLAYAVIAPNIADNYYKALSDPFIFGILFTGLVAMVIPSNSSFRIKDTNIFSKLGRYTYGMYVYHIIIINLLALIFNTFLIPMNTPFGMLLFTGSAFSITILISILSFFIFERPFLRLKKYFK